jgi:ABC-2 type transport system ATP-binding protein
VSAVVTITNLRKEFDDLVAVQGLDVSIPEGEIYGLIGPNGAGKTTTIRMACGLLEPTGGRVTVADVDVHRRTPSAPSNSSAISRISFRSMRT